MRFSEERAKERAKEVVFSLIEKYRDVVKSGKETDLLEEDVKIKFINPLLKGLGWDVEGLDEVKFEQRTPRGRIDFALRTDAASPPEILYEVKAFRENLDGYRVVAGKRQSYPKKVIDDAWSMKVDFCVLTNFKELRLYYSKVRNPAEGLIFKLKCEKHLKMDEFEKLWSLSKGNIKRGILERFEKKRTREDVSTEVVKELFKLRRKLMGNIHEENDLSPDELKESVQRILDRLVVIRVAEDRGVIHSESLSKMIATWKETAINKSVRTLMKDLKNLFRDFDTAYNSRLFEEHFCEDLKIDNRVLEGVVETLYNFNFELIDADVLGSIYEDYISHILRKEPELDIVEDYSIRKESGVYYTHTCIVEYIVENTVGKYLNEVSDPSQIPFIKVIDPACGSGSFLIKAFDFIKRWYDKYNEKILKMAKNDGSLKHYNSLVNNFRHTVITENLFGVDSDPQATEIASVNLMLKALRKGEKLPEIMGETVKCGNSLVEDPQEDSIAFLWEKEFEEIMKKGGFDICIGNPPWGADLSKNADYLERGVYDLASGQYDSYELFIELSKKILREGGIWGFVIPDSIFSPEHTDLRKFLCLENQIEKIVKLGEGFFKGVFRSSAIIIFKKTKPQKDHVITALTLLKEDRDNLMKGKTSISKIEMEKSIIIPQERFMKDENFTFDITKSIQDEKIMQKMENRTIDWEEIIDSSRGVEFSETGLVVQCPNCFKWDNPPRKRKGKYQTKKCSHCGFEYGFDGALKKDIIVLESKAKATDKPFIAGKSVNRYYTGEMKYLDVTREGITYKDPSLYEGEKILVRKTGVGIYATIDYIGAYVPQVVFIFKLKKEISREYGGLRLEYILGVINSRAILYYYYKKFGELEWKSFPYVTPKILKQLPLPDIDFSSPEEKDIHDKITEKVSDILNKKGDFEKLDFEIEELVMNLYGITPEMKAHIWNELRKVQKLRIIREVMG